MRDEDGLESRREGPPYAHSRNAHGHRQGLLEHIEAVATLARENAAAFGASALAEAVGHWHDLGKFHPDFQQYLLESEAGTRQKGTGPDHKAAGTLLAAQHCQPLAFIVAGHHGGLMDMSSLAAKVAEWKPRRAPIEALQLAPGSLAAAPRDQHPLPSLQSDAHAIEFFVRMLFSALVDADFLDTERHFSGDAAAVRGQSPDLQSLWQRFETFHGALATGARAPVSRVRRDVYEACLSAAGQPQGIFRLTVPTGGGKTLSSLGFALRHAITHGLRRVVVAVPYTTITEQTAGVYRAALGGDQSVLEHHSAIDPAQIDEQTEGGLWGRLASENWDAPVVVTTTVQLFESLFARSTSKCRKLHRLAGSVIIIDEAQVLPPHLLEPILDALRTLCARYRTTVVICTATQPAFDDAPGFRGLAGVTEIAPDPPALFHALRRVRYEVPTGEGWSWERVADEMRTAESALAIANTVGDSLELFNVLDDSSAFYLSTLLCGKHRRQVLDEIRRRLRDGEGCRLVSTQVVEAGVDLDFPLVLRALGPLDRIVQAAGRCNREGRLTAGRVVVFRPAEGKLPPGSYTTATYETEALLRGTSADLDDPELYHRYFRGFFGKVNLDERKIQELRGALRYEEVAKAFHMIADDTESVVVPYDRAVKRLLATSRHVSTLSRGLLRALQPYMVSVRRRQMDRYRREGLVQEVRPGLLEWLGSYDARRGLSAEHQVWIA